MGAALNKMVRICGDAEIAGLLCDAGLNTPGRVMDASNEVVEAAVGSENYAAVRALFPERGQE